MKYNALEKKAAALLESHPSVKSGLKFLYKRANYVLFAKLLRQEQLSSNAPSLVQGPYRSIFFGYYGKLQVNDSGLALACAADFDGRLPCADDKLKILVGPVNQPKHFEVIETTRAWNWQQGCMLQWLPCHNENRIIYNDYRHGEFVSCVRHINSGEKVVYDYPINAVSPLGNEALTLNYRRLFLLNPSYGYGNDSSYLIERNAPDNDGVWRMDLKTGECRLVLSLASLADCNGKSTMMNACHKVNHIEYSPDGTRFMVIHRWIHKGRKYSRLVTADVDGSGMRILADGDMVSHCAWKNSNQVLSWARIPQQGDRYWLISDTEGDCKVIGDGQLTEDGHPSFSPDGRYLLTDTYPDKAGMRSLLLFDLDADRLFVLGRFLSPLRYDGAMRCDLHPRWSKDGRFITFDSSHSGYRNTYIIRREHLHSTHEELH